MKLSPGFKKAVGIFLVIGFGLVELLFLIVLIESVIRGDDQIVQTATSFLYAIAMFFFPLWLGVRLWKAGSEASARPGAWIFSDNEIRIQAQVDVAEYRRLVFQLAYTRPEFVLLHVIIITMLVFWFNGGDPDYFTLVLFVFLLSLPLIVYYKAGATYKETKTLHEPVQYQFTSESFSVTGESFNLSIKWRALHNVRELKHWFLLYTGKHVAIPVPKRSFATAQDIDLFREMCLKFRDTSPSVATL